MLKEGNGSYEHAYLLNVVNIFEYLSKMCDNRTY